MKCPVCGEKTERVYADYLDNYLLMEEEIKCHDGHYGYSFCTGYWEEWVIALGKPHTNEGGYSDPEDRLLRFHYRVADMRFHLWCKIARQEWKTKKFVGEFIAWLLEEFDHFVDNMTGGHRE